MDRHDLDVLSLVGGAGFVTLGVLGLLYQGAGLSARWVLPILLIVVGVAGLVATRARSRGPS